MTARISNAEEEAFSGLEAQLRITNPTGLHARPAVKLAQLAARFKAEVWLRVGEQGSWVRAKSTAKVMKLKARADSLLCVRADGEQAEAALAALSDFIRRDFDEGPGSAEAGAKAGYELQPGAQSAATVQAGAASRCIPAQIASAGIALGPLWILQNAGVAAVTAVAEIAALPPEQQRQQLLQAINQAEQQLLRLGADSGSAMGTEIIAFQRSLLADEEFIAPVWQAVAGGQHAVTAWRARFEQEIDAYRTAGDDTLQARVVDLTDLRDRVLRLLAPSDASADAVAPAQAIVLADELTPSQFLELDWSQLGGAVMRGGSYNSHVAMLARAHGVPLLIQLQAEIAQLPAGVPSVLDAITGQLVLTPDAALNAAYQQQLTEQQARREQAQSYLSRCALTGDGTAIKVLLNVDDPTLLEQVDPAHCEGIGLTRTEFLFQHGLPDEASQYRVYRRIVEWAAGKPVTIRTLDAGGDKPVAGLTLVGERNPFLGLRGLRLMLARPDVFRVQLRALARAAVHGPLQVMLPMVTTPSELQQARTLLQAEYAALREAGIAAAMPAVGIMVEVPAAALTISDFDADFYSIGSNDLLQYLLAAARDSQALTALHYPAHPALLELIARVVEHGERRDCTVSLCGELAAQTEHLQAVLNTGLRCLSVPAAALGRVKAALAACQLAAD